MNWTIKLWSERYPGLGDKFPSFVECNGTREQAEYLADAMSNYYPGCDDIFYVVDPTDPDQPGFIGV